MGSRGGGTERLSFRPRSLHSHFAQTRMTAMPPQPLYKPALANAAYQLRYSWTGWASSGRFAVPLAELIAQVSPLWEVDGMRLLEHHCEDDALQLLFDALPSVSPQFLASRAKGRLDHAARQAGLRLPFSRKLAVRGVGENTRRDVEAYIERQVGKSFACGSAPGRG